MAHPPVDFVEKFCRLPVVDFAAVVCSEFHILDQLHFPRIDFYVGEVRNLPLERNPLSWGRDVRIRQTLNG
jgi:1-acyl-sn-glycerol-3-phosphate acyltransferase